MVFRPKIWYVCNKCSEFFYYAGNNPPKECPECKKGILIKTCGNCGKNFDKCKCKA